MRTGQTVRVRGGGGSGRNYGHVAETTYPDAISVPVATGEVALFSWIHKYPQGDGPPITIGVVSGESPVYHWVEAAIATGGGIGQGWLTGNGTYTFQLESEGSMSVDVDPGTATYKLGS
jgi:hypothetical protein